jgi:hypothetical protein
MATVSPLPLFDLSIRNCRLLLEQSENIGIVCQGGIDQRPQAPVNGL